MTSKVPVPVPQASQRQTEVVTPKRVLGLFQIKGLPPSPPGKPYRDLINTDPLSAYNVWNRRVLFPAAYHCPYKQFFRVCALQLSQK